MNGLMYGIISGTAVSGLVLMAASAVAPRVELLAIAPEAGAVAVPAGSEFNAERPDAPPILPGTEDRPDSTEAPVVAEPEAALESLPDTTPLDTPQTSPLAEAGLAAPDVPPTPEIVVGGNAGAAPETGISQPDVPAVDATPEPVQTADTPETGAAPDAMSDPVDEPDTLPGPSGAADAPETVAMPDTMSNPVVEVDVPPVSVPEAPQGLRLPVPEIEDMAPGVTTDRLPRIGADVSPPPVEADIKALSKNAAAFENPNGNPLVAMVLLDVGDVRPDPATLADFPLPVTMALDPTRPNATLLMQAYRAVGLEVAILTPLPEGAAPADVEVAFQSYFAVLSEAVAVLDSPDAVLQDGRPRASQVVEILAASGHGLITYDKGLNAGLQIASKSGVPAMLVFRNIDDGTHDVVAMKRLLDQAAFRVGQEGAVIMIAEARAETMTALAEWSLGSRAASVTFAPVSAVLMEK